MQHIGSNTLALTGAQGDWVHFVYANDAELWLCGDVFLVAESQTVPVTVQQLGTWLQVCNEQSEAYPWRQLSGFYSLVVRIGAQWLLISDRTRTYPLFYAAKPEGWLISDRIESFLPWYEQDEYALEQLHYSGYITGQRTRLKQVYQMQTAQWVKLAMSTVVGSTSGRYDSFQPYSQLRSNVSVDQWQDALATCLAEAIKRTIAVARGRTLVLPLSGGYDSRALAIALKWSGYSNVICFSFGAANSAEVTYARDIAAALQLPWLHVVYTAKTWRDLQKQPWYDDYLQFIHNGVSVATLQALPAVYELLRDQKIPPDALVIPGHTGDFVSGGHSTKAEHQQSMQLDSATSLVLHRHFSYQSLAKSKRWAGEVQQELADLVQQAKAPVMQQAVLSELWNYNERQAKLICNSNRYYEFFGLQCWMPLWDLPLYEFWQQVPAELRHRKTLWTTSVDGWLAAYPGTTSVQGNAAEPKSRVGELAGKLVDFFNEPNRILAVVPFYYWLWKKLTRAPVPSIMFSYVAKQICRLNLKPKVHLYKDAEK